MILVDGNTGDVRSYDYNTDTWASLTSVSVSGGGDEGIALSYDSESDRVIIVDGDDGNVFSYDYNTGTFTAHQSHPSSNFGGGFPIVMSYDSESDRVMIVSGHLC